MTNKELQAKYDEMHKAGVSSWFSDGKEERETILKMGEPWDGKMILEIGCGEGELSNMIMKTPVIGVMGIDYSQEAIKTALQKYGEPENRDIDSPMFEVMNYRDCKETYNRIVLQGVLEHLDNPFVELKWMIDNLLVKGGDVITSSPCFLNPRGIVWMTLDMLGAVMSKTDLHYLHPWDFEKFCVENGYKVNEKDCDYEWGNGEAMLLDFAKRIPLAVHDGKLKMKRDFGDFLNYLSVCECSGYGATMVYKISTPIAVMPYPGLSFEDFSHMYIKPAIKKLITDK